MQTIKLSILSLIAVVGFIQPSVAQSNPKAKDQPKPNVVKVASRYRIITIAPGYAVANLYKTQSTDSTVLKAFKGGERVKELETKGTMMKVTFENATGWIKLR